MTRLLVAAAAVAALLSPAAQACDLKSCVRNLPVCGEVRCDVCYQHEYERWCLLGS